MGVAARGGGDERALAAGRPGERVVVGARLRHEARAADLLVVQQEHGGGREDGDDEQHQHATGEGHPPTGSQIARARGATAT